MKPVTAGVTINLLLTIILLVGLGQLNTKINNLPTPANDSAMLSSLQSSIKAIQSAQSQPTSITCSGTLEEHLTGTSTVIDGASPDTALAGGNTLTLSGDTPVNLSCN